MLANLPIYSRFLYVLKLFTRVVFFYLLVEVKHSCLSVLYLTSTWLVCTALQPPASLSVHGHALSTLLASYFLSIEVANFQANS